jgi:hypothetical protein
MGYAMSSIDSYSQVRVFLTMEEAKLFESSGLLETRIWQAGSGRDLPLRLSTSGEGWRTQGVPVDVGYEEKEAYEIDVPPDGPRKILEGEIIGSGYPDITLRMVYMSLDTVY